MEKHSPIEKAVVAIRYIVHDVDASVAFYTGMLGFEVKMHVKPGFASLQLGDLQLFINQPGAGGAGQPMPDGTMPAPGGWNRSQIQVEDIESTIEKLKKAGAKFRNNLLTGVGGKQVLLEDPSGNLIELFQPGSQ
ncbi:VOC family protein [Paraflavitalea soli]|uniref:VOC family protein n=1 Tax=Paraflavitalea soli TaxID=2315862 RepID=A0A3B7MRB9_9BACT|nr:VOC family protein [Paraflavitalea soli]AXY74155.1 VOC family protein [Paraflavitalea soli]